MKDRTLIALFLAPALLAAQSPAHAEESSRATELYHIFDIKTAAKRDAIIKALQDGLNPNISKSDTITPLVMGAPPETPGKFTLVNPFEASPLGGLIPASQMAQMRQVRCDGAVWISTALRKVRGSNQLKLTMCLFPYAQGYHLDIHAIDIKERGGGLSERLGRAIGTAIVGNSDDWTKKTIIDVVRNVNRTLAPQIRYVEGQPELTGTPWLEAPQLTPSAADKATSGNSTAPNPEPQPNP